MSAAVLFQPRVQQQQQWRWQRPAAAAAAAPRRRRLAVAAGMHVPSESFGGVSPERRAAQSMLTFFTFVAAKIVMSQLEGIGRGDLGAYNAAGAVTLRRFLLEEPMRDSAAWLAKLMQEDELLGVRIMEVRDAYAKEDFEWGNLKRLTLEGLAEDNTRLLRQHATERFGTLLEQTGGGGGGEGPAAPEQ